MTTTWTSCMTGLGYYYSNSYKINNIGNTNVTQTEVEVDDSNGLAKVEYAYGADDKNWSAWLPLESGTNEIFGKNSATTTYVKFRVSLSQGSPNKSGVYKSVTIKSNQFTVIINSGDLKVYPKIWIRQKGRNTKIKLINKKNDSYIEFKNIAQKEEVFVDMSSKTIISDYSIMSRYNDHVGGWLYLDEGENYLVSEGDFEFDIKFSAPMLHD